MDRLKLVFIVGMAAAVLGAFSAVLVLFCTGLVLMTAAICTVEIAEAIQENK